MRSQDLIRHYINIVESTQSGVEEKARNPYAIGMAQAMKSTGDKPPLKKSTIVKAHDIAKRVKGEGRPEEESVYDNLMAEKWGKPTKVAPSERGKYKGRSIEDLRSRLSALKKSGPHKKGSPEYGRMRELQFAIRAKTGWGKVGTEEYTGGEEY